ncbi:MAG: hypothetical protein ACI89U_000413 [Gammaproteobacteria bacterium]|jgi:hypothetical protein
MTVSRKSPAVELLLASVKNLPTKNAKNRITIKLNPNPTGLPEIELNAFSVHGIVSAFEYLSKLFSLVLYFLRQL